jgi:hypothetical protein
VQGEGTLLDDLVDADAQLVWHPERCLLHMVE